MDSKNTFKKTIIKLCSFPTIMILLAVFLSMPASALDDFPNAGCFPRLAEHNKQPLSQVAKDSAFSLWGNRSYWINFWSYSGANSGWDLFLAPENSYNYVQKVANTSDYQVFTSPGVQVYNWDDNLLLWQYVGIDNSSVGTPPHSSLSWTVNQLGGCFGFGNNFNQSYLYELNSTYYAPNDYNFNNLLPPAPTYDANILYNISNQIGVFKVDNFIDNYTYTWTLTYGSLEGDPQLETWTQSGTEVTFNLPYIAPSPTQTILGSYNLQVITTDIDNEVVDSTSINFVIKKDFLNFFTGNCKNDDCENTPVSSNAISTNLGTSCNFMAEYPFFNYEDCSEAINANLKIMTFQPLNISNAANQKINCRNLEVLNLWLNLPENYEVCPIFSNQIRDIITPFLTFALGLTTIGYFIKKGTEN